jgi:hypothetical protein
MPHLRLLLLALAALAAVVLAACGGGSSDDPGQSQSAKAQKAGIAFARCMRAHGVDIADPKGPGLSFHVTGHNTAQMEAAQKACGHFLQGTVKPPSAAEQAKVRDNALKFAKCMRAHGVDFPDPRFSGGKIMMEVPGAGGGKPNPNDPTLQAAQRVCQHFMGPPPPGAPGGPRGGSTAGGGKEGGPEFGIQVAPGGKP